MQALWGLKVGANGVHALYSHMQGQPGKERRVWNWAVVGLGVLCALSGTTASLRALLSAS
jgi:hypothetical protein